MTIALRRLPNEGRADTYHFLGALFVDRPDPDNLACMRSLALGLESGASCPADTVFATLLSEPNMVRLARRLRAQYDLLFASFKNAGGLSAPCESFWRVAPLDGGYARCCERLFRRSGYHRQDIALAADHLAEELMFMAYLCQTEARAERIGDAEAVRKARQAQRHFMTQHLSCWVPGYCRTLSRLAEEPFYRALFGATIATLSDDTYRLTSET